MSMKKVHQEKKQAKLVHEFDKKIHGNFFHCFLLV